MFLEHSLDHINVDYHQDMEKIWWAGIFILKR